MKSLVKSFAALAILLAGFSATLNADAWDKRTILTISEPIQIPQIVLQPGKYVFKLMDSQYRHVIKVYNGDETKLITTIIAMPNERLHRTDKSQFAFWESAAGQPKALRAWFYPNDNFGHEFTYEPAMAAQISAYNKTEVVPTTKESDQDLKDLDVARTDVKTIETSPATVQQSAEIARDTPPAALAPITVAAAGCPPISDRRESRAAHRR